MGIAQYFVIALVSIALVLSTFLGISVITMAIYKYGRDDEADSVKKLTNGVQMGMLPLMHMMLPMGMPVDSIIYAEEMTDEELEFFMEDAEDHPELYIDGKKIDKAEGLIYIDFNGTRFGGDIE